MSTKTKWITLIGILMTILIFLPVSVWAAQADTGIQATCSLLDNPTTRGLMSAMFERRLLEACGRLNELNSVVSNPDTTQPSLLGTDVLVNNPALDTGASQTQSETTIAINENTGTICSGYNDSYSGVVLGQGYTGFSRSTDGGASFTDLGALSSNSYGDPSLIWRKSDGYFYIASLYSTGSLGLWKSTDDCQTFTFVVKPTTGSSDDKEMMTVDNNVTSPFYGRMYIAWTDFSSSRIRQTYSDNTTTWSTGLYLSGVGVSVQGAWPTVSATGDVFTGWVRWNPYYSGPIDIEVARSTNGGVSASLVTDPMTGKVNPYQSAATNSCGRPALNGKIRYLPSPQLVVSPDGCVNVVYSYDPDGRNVGDVVNVYFRRSCDNGTTWGSEILLNDDGTTTDQYYPTISAGSDGMLAATWYDRRLDTAGNLLFDYYARTSTDGGTTWGTSTRVSDVSSPVYMDPNLATCYHGDYDQQKQFNNAVYIQWSDDHLISSGHNDPNVFFDKLTSFTDFSLAALPISRDVCSGNSTTYDLTVGAVNSTGSAVTLDATGLPFGATFDFNNNPVTPPGTSIFSVHTTPSVVFGSYTLTITGNSGAFLHSVDVNLNVFTRTPGKITLLTPVNNATNVARRPTYSWNAAVQGTNYFLQVATDPLFTNIVYTAKTISTSHTSTIQLSSKTLYYWRVRSVNACGSGKYSTIFSFTTR